MPKTTSALKPQVFSFEDMKNSINNPLDLPVILNGMEMSEPEQPQQATAGQSFKAFLIIAVFIGAIISAAIFSQTEPMLCIASVGSVFLVIGLISLFQNGLSLDDLPLLIMPTVGLLMTGIPIIMVYHRTHPDSFNITNENVYDIILACLAVVGFVMTVAPHISHRSKMSKCSETIQAKCIYYDTKNATSRGAYGRIRHYHLYSPTWQYEINGTLYVTKEPAYTDYEVPHIGDMREIRYDPTAPQDIYRPTGRNILIVNIIGIMCLLMGLGTLYLRHK